MGFLPANTALLMVATKIQMLHIPELVDIYFIHKKRKKPCNRYRIVAIVNTQGVAQ
jgi:hypothetical protein